MPIFGPNISGLFSKPTQNRFFSRKKLTQIAFAEPRPLRIKVTDGIYFAKNLYRVANISNRDWFYRSDDSKLEFYRYSIDSLTDALGLVLYNSNGNILAECYRLVSSSQYLSSFPFPLFTDQWISNKADLYVENATPQIIELSFSSPQNFVYSGHNASYLVSFTKTPTFTPGGLPIPVLRNGETNIGNVTVTLSTELANYLLPNDNAPQTIAVNISKKPVTVAFTAKTFTYNPNSSYSSGDDFSISDLVTGDTTANSFSNVLVGIPPIGSNAGSYAISLNPSYSSTKYIITNAPSNVTWQILKADQTISFSLATTAVASSTIPLFATSTSNLPVSFSVQSGPGTITNGVLSFSDAGNVVIRASQSGNQNYNPATAVDKTVEVSSSPTGSGIARNEAYDIYIQGTEGGAAYDGYYVSSSPFSSSFWNKSDSNFTQLIGPPDGPNWSLYNADQSEQIDVYNDSVDGNFVPTTNWKKRNGSPASEVFVTSPLRIIANSFPIRNPNNDEVHPDAPRRLVINGFNCSYGDFRTRNLRLILQTAAWESRFTQWTGYDSGHIFVLSEYADPLFGYDQYGQFSYQFGVFPNSTGSFVLLASRSSELDFTNFSPRPWPKTFPTTGWSTGPAGSTGVLRFYTEQFPFPEIYIPSTQTAAPNSYSVPSVWLRPDTGVTTYTSQSSPRISQWSSSGTLLPTTFTALNSVAFGTISGPQLVNNVLNGYPVVRFDSNGSDTDFSTSGTGLNVDLPADRNLTHYSMTYIFVWRNDPTMIQSYKRIFSFNNNFLYPNGSTQSRSIFQSFVLISNANHVNYSGWSSYTYLRDAYGGSGWGVATTGLTGTTPSYFFDQYSGSMVAVLPSDQLYSVVGGNGFKIYSYSYNPIERVQELRINGTVVGQSPIHPLTPKPQALFSISLGRTPESGSSFARVSQGGLAAQGDLAEFIFYNNALPGREVQKITNHLKAKYAII